MIRKSTNIGGAMPGTTSWHPLDEVMETYDSLAPNLKKLYDLMPVCADPGEDAQMEERFGPERAESMIREYIQRAFPSWGNGIERKERRA